MLLKDSKSFMDSLNAPNSDFIVNKLMEGFISEYMFSNDCFYTKIYSARKDELESINVNTLNFIEPEDSAFTFTINKFL